MLHLLTTSSFLLISVHNRHICSIYLQAKLKACNFVRDHKNPWTPVQEKWRRPAVGNASCAWTTGATIFVHRLDGGLLQAGSHVDSHLTFEVGFVFLKAWARVFGFVCSTSFNCFWVVSSASIFGVFTQCQSHLQVEGASWTQFLLIPALNHALLISIAYCCFATVPGDFFIVCCCSCMWRVLLGNAKKKRAFWLRYVS